MSKVVAISFGRKMSNTDVMLKEVLIKCQEAGHEIQFIRPDDLNICLLYTSPSPRDANASRMPSSA